MSSSQQALAAFLTSFPRTAISDAARDIARQSLIDTIAVALAGRREQASLLADAYVSDALCATGAVGWVNGRRYRPEAAALLNAVAAHALDYDDVTPAWRGHPGTVLWPALYATAASIKESPSLAELLDAYVLGFEVGARISKDLIAHHYPAGWHATCTIGVIAATSACARLLRLDESKACHAIGLAVAQSSGVQANFGSSAKPLQAGFAASSAVRSARLAAIGVQSSERALEGPKGFSALYGDVEQIRVEPIDARDSPLSIVRMGIEVKQFPNCYATHRGIEAALRLHDRVRDQIDQISRITAEGSPNAHAPLIIGVPDTVDKARFSLEFGIACALLEGGVRLQSFEPELLHHPRLRHLMNLTRVSESATLGPDRTARVTIEMANGAQLAESVSALPGQFGEPTFMRRLADKVSDCLSYGGLATGANALWDEFRTRPGDADGSLLYSPALGRIWAQVECEAGNRV